MGICMCEKHGRSGIVAACAHVAASIDTGTLSEFHVIDVFGRLLVCSDCLKAHGLDVFVDHPGIVGKQIHERDEEVMEASLATYERVEPRKAYCSNCVAEVEMRQARSEGRPHRLPVCERTLTSLHQDAIDRLKQLLLDQFAFQPSMVRPDERALEVYAGSYGYHPLLVKTYYVVVAEDQDRIVDCVSAFLRDQELNQAKIEFWEAEVWPPRGPPNSPEIRRGARGRETLLRTVNVNS